MSVLMGNGDGTFQPQQVYPTCTNPVQVVVADMNRDGKPDLVVLCATRQISSWAPSMVSVLLGNGDGTFQVHKDYSAQIGTWQTNGEYVASQLLVGDLNGDSYPDVVTLGYGDSQGEVHVLLNAGAGQNGALQPVMLADPAAAGAGALLDITGNGILDLAYVYNYFLTGVGNPVGGAAWAFGDGTGHFINDNTSQIGCQIGQGECNVSNGITAGDLNGDGKPDLVVSTTNGPCTMLNQGNGNFTACQLDSPPPLQNIYPSGQILLADFNNSGRVDVLVFYNLGAICPGALLQILLGHGDGTFQAGPMIFNTLNSVCNPKAQSVAAVGDLNGDGLPDIALITPSGNLAVYLNTSSTPDQAPVASNASFNVIHSDSGQPSLNATLSATSPLNNPLAFATVTPPAHGSVQITNASTGAFSYSPSANFCGADSFAFNANDGYMNSNTSTVKLTVVSTPVANNDSIATTAGQSVSATLSGTDPCGLPLTFTVTVQGSKGKMVITNAATGAFTYTPTTGQTGQDSVQFSVSNGYTNTSANESIFIGAAQSGHSGGGGMNLLILTALCLLVCLKPRRRVFDL